MGELRPKNVGAEDTTAISSLEGILQTLEKPTAPGEPQMSKTQVVRPVIGSSMPPLDAVVAVLRWAKGFVANID